MMSQNDYVSATINSVSLISPVFSPNGIRNLKKTNLYYETFKFQISFPLCFGHFGI